MPHKFGIDLGTTLSVISYYDEASGQVVTVDLPSSGERLLPSVVYFPGPGQEPIVGKSARSSRLAHDDEVIANVKRSMGENRTWEIHGVAHTPEEVSSHILKALAKDAQTFTGEPVKDVVITVPAYFKDDQRRLTKQAGEMAGLNVLAILSEPHAAALALALALGNVTTFVDRFLLVFDLGGGTLDVTLIRPTVTDAPETPNALNMDPRTICKDGIQLMGGLNFDKVLMDLVADKAQQQFGEDVLLNPQNKILLLDRCEEAKKELTFRSPVMVMADLAGKQVEVTAGEFEAAAADLVDQCKRVLESVLAEAEQQTKDGTPDGEKITRADIDVFLAGGATRMPMIKRMVEQVMGKEPITQGNPDLLVSIGAAYWAHLLEPQATVPVSVPTPDGGHERKDVGITDVVDITSESVGVEVMRPDGQGGWTPCNNIVLKKGAAPGDTETKTYETIEDGMTEIRVILYAGESEDLSQCRQLATFVIAPLPPDLPRGTKVDVTLTLDSSGIVQGKAVVETGESVDIKVDMRRSSQ